MGRSVSLGREEQPSAANILAALDGLLASESLRLSERNRRFLSFVVNRTVAGQADRIKAYMIGVDVFGRDESFDPGVDPIVRIEATRLRSALTAHYEGAGAEAAVRIAIPPGSYVPVFSWAAPQGGKLASETPRVGPDDQPTVVIKDQTGPSDRETELRGELFVDALATRLGRAGFKVFAMPPAERRAAAAALDDLFENPGNAFSLDVAVRTLSDLRRFSWRFSDLRDGRIRVSDFSDHPAEARPCFARIDGIADSVAASLGKALATF